MGEDDDVGFTLTFFRLTLQHGVDGNRVIGQDAGHVGQHTCLVFDAQTQVITGNDFAHRQHRQRRQGMRLEGQVRHAMFRIGRRQTGDIDQIGDDRRRSRLGTSALAVVKRGANGIALHHDGVHRPLDIGEQTLGRNQGRVHAQFHTVFLPLGDTQQLDTVAQLLGVLDVRGFELGDPLDVGLVELHRNTEGNGAHQGCLMRGIDAFNIEGRVSFGVTQALRLGQHVGEGQPLVAHFRKDEVGGAVDDAGSPFDTVGRQAFAQRLDDGNATRHRRLESNGDALGLRGSKNLGAMHGKQGLVGRDDMLAIGDCLHHHLAGHTVAADQFDDDVDFRVIDQGEGIIGNARCAAGDLLR